MFDPRELDMATKQRLMEIAKVWYDQMDGGDVPSITLPTLTKYNMEFDDDSEVWTYGAKESTRKCWYGEVCD